MHDLPKPVRTRSTAGSLRLADFADRHGVRPVAWYVPLALHEALLAVAARHDLTLQTMLAHACASRYGDADNPAIPPLCVPTRTTQEPHKNVTWYAPIELIESIKLISLRIRASTQQLITSAMVEQYHAMPEVKALRITTGVAPYLRRPDTEALSFFRPAKRQT